MSIVVKQTRKGKINDKIQWQSLLIYMFTATTPY